MATQPDLGITNPYALDQEQFDAAIALLEAAEGPRRSVLVAVHRPAGRARGRHRAGRDHVAGHRQPRPGERRHDRRREAGRGRDRLVRHVDDLVAGGASRTACTCGWTGSSRPRPTPQVAEWFGEAPSNAKSCDLTAVPEHCDIFHAGETEYWEDVWYWTTPTEECLDGRTDVDVRAVHGMGQRLEHAAGLSH